MLALRAGRWPDDGTAAAGRCPRLTVDYCGEVHPARPGHPLVIGRDAEIAIDDNPFLHRHFLEVSDRGDLWWLANVGTVLSATVADEFGGLQAWLAPGGQLPLVFPRRSCGSPPDRPRTSSTSSWPGRSSSRSGSGPSSPAR